MKAHIAFAIVLASGVFTATNTLHVQDIEGKPEDVVVTVMPPVTLDSLANKTSPEYAKELHKRSWFILPKPKSWLPNVTDLKLSVKINLPPPVTNVYNISYVMDAMGQVNKAMKSRIVRFPVEEGVRFELFTPKNPKHPQIFTLANATATNLQQSNFDPSYPTRILIHGWNCIGRMPLKFADAYFEKGKHKINFFVVNWRAGAVTMNYIVARSRVNKVGRLVAKFIDFLAENGVQLENLHLIGHSLGAHVSGIAGKKITRGKIRKIVGLDPAKPLFNFNDTKNRLADTDAEYVEVIHTCAGLLGFAEPLGHASFYPNGGKSQPGCGWDMTGACAHQRAYEFYIESIYEPKFYALQCDSLEHVQSGTCEVINHVLVMGAEPGNVRAKGIYYLQTNSLPTYSRDDKDILLSILLSTQKIPAKKWYTFYKN